MTETSPATDTAKVRPTGILLLAIWDFLFSAALIVAGFGLAAWGLAGDGGTGVNVAGLLSLLLGGLHLVTAIGLLKLAPWSRSLRIGLALVGLLGFPILTFVSILALVMLVNGPMRVLYIEQTIPGAPLPDRSDGLIPGVLILLSVAAAPIVFIVLAIAIPNLLNAIDRGKQKRTMADLRSVATAVETYSIDHEVYPRVDSFDALVPHIQPRYIRAAPRLDGWGRPLVFRPKEDGGYLLYSPAKDGRVEDRWPGGPTVSLDADIVMEDGRFVQWPEAMQQR